jgi:acyl-CoA reductase-like NAD-dependent aldehyde dehydrogenase
MIRLTWPGPVTSAGRFGAGGLGRESKVSRQCLRGRDEDTVPYLDRGRLGGARTPIVASLAPTPGSQLRVENPATGALIAEIPAASAAEVSEAVSRARRAQAEWGRLPFSARAAALRRLSGRILRDADLAETVIAENGKPRYEVEAIEIFYTCELTRFFTSRRGRRALADDVRRPFIFANKRARVVHHPHGVVGVIGPWNWPLLNNYADCVAPLLAGNAVILKPSQVTPLTSLRVATLWREEGLPEGVFQVLAGRTEVGEALIEAADMIFFTGSQPVGRKIAARCGERLIPCVVELGGKSPFIVLEDADLAAAARAAVWGAFANSGQVCIRPERVLVAEPVAEAFTQLCLRETARLRQGSELGRADGGAVDVGAMTSGPQLERMEEQMRAALAAGARILTGGRRRIDLPGHFFEPTLLVDVTPTMAIAREETFGPLLPIVRVRDAEAAVRIANETGNGLSGSVWSGDFQLAASLARRLEVGSVCINDVLVNYFCVEAPLGGVKGSGLGVRHGIEGLKQFCRVETIVEDAPLLGLLSSWIVRQLGFPYKGPVLKVLRWLMRRLY